MGLGAAENSDIVEEFVAVGTAADIVAGTVVGIAAGIAADIGLAKDR